MRIVFANPKKLASSKALFFAFFQKENIEKERYFSFLPTDTKRTVLQFAKKEFKGEEGEVKSLWLQKGPITKIALFGLGEKEKWNERKKQLIPRFFVQYAKNNKISEFSVPITKIFGQNLAEAAKTFSTNAVLAGFEFNKYKEAPKEGWPEIETLYLISAQDDAKEMANGIQEGVIIAQEVNFCRELANTPGGDMTPKKLSNEAKNTAKRNGINVKILGEKEMQKLGMGEIGRAS